MSLHFLPAVTLLLLFSPDRTVSRLLVEPRRHRDRPLGAIQLIVDSGVVVIRVMVREE